MATDRLDRIEAILERVAAQQESFREDLAGTKAIADSNARAVQAWEQRINDSEAESQEIATSIGANVNHRIDVLAEALQGLIRERRDDWSEWREQQAQVNTESSQRFNNLLEDARADRKRNEAEHQAFRESFQTLLGEIRSIWQRLNAS